MHHITPVFWAILLLVAFVAGAVNALAGGGTFLTFPTLLIAGLDSISANATSTVFLIPGSFASSWVYRKDLPFRGSLLIWILVICAVGGLLGSQLLVMTPSERFAKLAPYLILVAALVYSFSKQLTTWSVRHTGGKPHMVWFFAVLFVISIYGGYFGAGMGVLMIVLFQLSANLGVQQSAGLRTQCAVAINLLAVPNFILRGVVDWTLAIPLLVCALAGGYAGAHAVQRLSAQTARRTVLLYAWGMGIYLLIR